MRAWVVVGFLPSLCPHPSTPSRGPGTQSALTDVFVLGMADDSFLTLASVFPSNGKNLDQFWGDFI